MSNLYERWCSHNIVLRILAGLIVGTVLAALIPGLLFIEILGDLFIGASGRSQIG